MSNRIKTTVSFQRPLRYERVYLPLYEVADTPFHSQGDANFHAQFRHLRIAESFLKSNMANTMSKAIRINWVNVHLRTTWHIINKSHPK